MASHPTQSTTQSQHPRATGQRREGERAALPAGNAGLWAFLRQAAVIALGSALAGVLAVLFFAQLQGAF